MPKTCQLSGIWKSEIGETACETPILQIFSDILQARTFFGKKD